MEWRDEGIVLAARRHGERDAVASLLTFEHGRHAGLVRGGAGRRLWPLLQPGNRLECAWRARLSEHLGGFTVEPVRLHVAGFLEDPLRLAAVASACALLEAVLPERDPHPPLYAALLTLLGRMGEADDWPADYVRFELLLLVELGYALDLTSCAVTGSSEGLAFVSPRSGRAVSSGAAEPWVSRLLPLPPFLIEAVDADDAQIVDGLRLAGHFLRRHILEPADRPMPVARDRLSSLLQERSQETSA
ncbi:DNA repair protein RecO [Geminicoccaceae bacterium 1502E]|nr:DNA repair protein RecO [Geminicoccaceae bacterium 1502E]